MDKKRNESMIVIIISNILKYKISFCLGNPCLIITPVSTPATPANRIKKSKYIIGYFVKKDFIFINFNYLHANPTETDEATKPVAAT